MKKLVFIEDLKIYGIVVDSWNVTNNDATEINYIVKDMAGVEHELLGYEIEFVEDINDTIKKAKCNISLEALIKKFASIDKNFTLSIEVSSKKEHEHSDIYVPYVFVNYGDSINFGSNEENHFERVPCIIKDGKLFVPLTHDYVAKMNEYECCLFSYNADVKDVVFELYMNIISRLEK